MISRMPQERTSLDPATGTAPAAAAAGAGLTRHTTAAPALSSRLPHRAAPPTLGALLLALALPALLVLSTPAAPAAPSTPLPSTDRTAPTRHVAAAAPAGGSLRGSLRGIVRGSLRGIARGSVPAPKSSSDGRRSRRDGPPPGSGGSGSGAGTGAAAKRSTAAAVAAASGAPDTRPQPWEGTPFAADPGAVARAAAQFEGTDGEPVVVLLSDQRYAVDDAGRETFTQRLVYRILSAAADGSWSTIERSWSPWHQARPEVRARVITAEGVAHSLDPAVLTESGEVQDSPDMFGDGRVLRGPLPATGPGVVVEQEVTVRDTAPFFDAGVVEIADVAASVSVHHARIVVEAPARPQSPPLRWVARLLPPAAPRDETVAAAPPDPPLRRLTFDYRDLAANDEPEPGLPPEAPRSPYLAFSTGRSWSDVARRYSEVVDQAIRGSDLAPLIRAAGGPAPSQLETMNRLLTRLGEIRYTGVELGQGGILPRTPAETLRRKFGDCKDKAVLLIAALRALDIPAYAALLNAGDDQQDVEQDLPGFGAFNHAIVVVPGNPPVWIDPTDRFARAGELPTDDQGRLALIASPTATGLARTPEAAAGENRAVKVREFFLADQGAARAVETDEYWGAAERDLRAFYTAEEPEALRQAVSDYMRKTFLAKDVSAYDHANPLDLSRPFRLRLETRETRRAVTDEKGAAVAIFPAALLDQLPDELTSQEREKPAQPRLADYYFSRPFIAESVYRIVPPPGFAPQPLPANRVRRLGPASLAEEYAAAGDGIVTVTLRLESGKRRISPEEFERLRGDVRELAAAKPIVVQYAQLGEADLAAGRVREAIAEFQREAMAAPKKALPRCRLARALLAGGMGEAARQEAERAVRLEPRSATAQRTLGWVLQHDRVGRRFGAGFDRAGAIAAYRRAKDLDADDETSRADLAILLEHDAQGRRYAAGADLAGAVAEYQALRQDLKSKAMDDNLLIALLRAGRFAEMKSLAAELDDTPGRNALRLAAAAATSGADEAVRDAERRIGDPAALVAALDGAAEELVALRRYGEATALLARAARQSPGAAAFLARAEALRRVRRHEDAPLAPPAERAHATGADPAGRGDAPGRADLLGPGGPAAAAKRFLLATLADPPATDRLLALLGHGLATSLGPAARRDLVEAPARGLRGAPGRQQLSPDVRQDLVIAAWRTVVHGDDRLGYRVEISSTVGESAGRSAFFVVPESGEYRLAAFGFMPATLGFEALRRLAAHDPRGARQWLEWAAEELQQSPSSAARAATTNAPGPAGDPPAMPLLALLTPAATVAAAGAPGSADDTAAGAAGTPGATGTPDGVGETAAGAGAAAAAARPASVSPAELTDLHCAAASLAATAAGAATAPQAQAILATLRTCRDRAAAAAAAEPRGPAPLALAALEMALADAYAGLGRFRELLEVAGRLAATRPDSGAVFDLQGRALAGLERWADLEALARRRLQLHPDDAPALRLAARAASRRGDLQAAAALLREIVDSGRESAGDLNELAWMALAGGHPDDQAIEDAQRAAALSGYRDAAILHTLAAVYAERGQAAEAYRIAVQSIDARSAAGAAAAAEPEGADWYVFGHLAESYGLTDVARRLYARVPPAKPQEHDTLSTFRLAQARLAALGTVREAAAKAGHAGR